MLGSRSAPPGDLPLRIESWAWYSILLPFHRGTGSPVRGSQGIFMPDFVLRVGSRSAQGVRSNNEDRLHVDLGRKVFIVADGMGGQERGEIASGLAVDIIPKVLNDRLAAEEAADEAVAQAFASANSAIIEAGKGQPEGRRMGTTAVCALHAG